MHQAILCQAEDNTERLSSSVPSLFSALSIHTLAMGKKNTIQWQLAENKSRQCILALSELAKTWPVGMWVVKSFSNLVRRLLSRGSLLHQEPRQILAGHRNENDGSSKIYRQPGIPTVDPFLVTGPHMEAGPDSPAPDGDVSMITDEVFGSLPGGADPTQLFQSHTYPDYFSGAISQPEHDSAWYGCLENILDLELLQKELGMGTR
ncbi:cutinase transcription factor 1 beta [Fusarium bulbicola]|nr:cutinase transcription factor 1 beta [Fusarium bulbicola]